MKNMKKVIFGSMIVLSIAAVATFNVQLNTTEAKKLSGISLANVDMLAYGEDTGEVPNNSLRKVYESVTSFKTVKEIFDSVEVTCKIIQTTCPGTGDQWCESAYSKNCS